MGRCKSLGSLKSFLSYASLLSEATILTFSLPNPSSQAPQSSPWVVADGCWIADIFLPGCPLGSEVHIRWAGITDDGDPDLLIWQEILHFLVYNIVILYMCMYL